MNRILMDIECKTKTTKYGNTMKKYCVELVENAARMLIRKDAFKVVLKNVLSVFRTPCYNIKDEKCSCICPSKQFHYKTVCLHNIFMSSYYYTNTYVFIYILFFLYNFYVIVGVFFAHISPHF